MDFPERQAPRRGSLILETVIAALLLATATVALAKLAQSASMLDRHANERLAAMLMASNTIERLRGTAADELAARAEEVAKAVGERHGGEITVVAEPFEVDGARGVHLTVEATSSPHVEVTLHDWRVAPSAGDQDDAEDTDADADEQQRREEGDE